MERPEVIDPLKEEESVVEQPKPSVEEQTEETMGVRGLAERRLGKVGTGILDFVPIAGDVLAAGDVAESYRKGDALGTAVNVAALGVGVVPIVGDLAAKGLKKALGTYRRSSKIDNEVIDKGMEDIVDSDVVVSSTPKAGGDNFVKRQSDIDKKLDKDEISVAEWEAESKNNAINFKSETGIDVTDKYPEIRESAVRYYKEIEEGVPVVEARKKHLDVIERVNPIREWDDVPLPTSPKQQVLSLKDNQRRDGTFLDVSKQEAKKLSEKLNHPIKTAKLKKGDIIKGRLDIPAYTKFNSWITTILTKSIKGSAYGDAIHYTSPPNSKVKFTAAEGLARNIVTRSPMRGGKPNPKTGKVEFYDKTPFALVEGAYNPMSAKQIRTKVKKLLKDPEWTQLGFDPRRLTGFYTRNNRDQFPVGSIAKEADEVFQIGPLLLAKNVKLDETPRLNKGGAIRTYKEGGVVPMQEQMNFAFMNEGGVLADDGVDRDPVSGNEVPAGSMAEEVRDDVPAMLSEGEYVVPADVVRFHGIDKFEELRDQAKAGLARMEADGRIGGQPVEQQDDFPFPVEELEGFQEGGVVGDIYPDVMGQPFTPGQRYPSSDRFPGVGFELRNFTNPTTGKTVVVPFFNGKPMQYIPPDFLEGGATTTRGGTIDPANRQEDEAEKTRLLNQFGENPMELTPLAKGIVDKVIAGESSTPQTKPFSQYSPEDFGNYLKQRQSGIGRVFDNLPIVGLLTTMQDNAAREFARKSLIQGKNFVTGEPITNKEADILMQVADMPKGKSLLSTIESFLTGKPSIEIDDRPPIDTELRRTTYEPEKPVATQQDVSALYGDRQFTPETIGEDPQQQYYGPEGFQNIIESAKGTVAQEAKKIIDKGDDYDAEKVDKESAERMKRAISILKSPAQAVREFLGAKPADAQEMTDSTAKQIAAYNQAENTILKEEVSMADSQGNSLGNTTDEILGNIEKSSNINYNESTKLFEPYQVRRADGTLEPFWTIGVGQKLTENLPVDANGVITSAPPAGQTKEQVVNNFKKNVRTAFDGAKKVMEEDYGAVWGNLPAGGMSVTTQVAFQNGIKYKDPTTGKLKGLFEFKKANKALAKGDIATAQKEYLDSKWGKADSPRRAKLVVGDLAPNSTVNTIWKRTTAVTKPAEDAPLPDALLQQETGFDPTVSQPLQQTFVPPSVPTRDDILKAGGIDAYVESLPQDVEQKAQGLQDLPVGVSIEADGRFTGTGGLGDQTQTAFGLSPGALGGRIVETPQVSQRRRRDTPTSTGLLEFGGTGGGAKTRLDSRARLKEQASLRRLQDSIAQTGAVQPPSMDDQMAAITDVTPAAPESLVLRQQPPISPGGMGGVLPQVGETAPQPITPFTPLSKPSDISKLMPSTADIQAQKAAEARKAREEQEKKIYEETQARIAKQMADAAKEEQQKKARLEAEATEKARLEALKKDREERDRIKKTNQMNQARNEVIMAGGDPFEADKAAHAVFLDQSDAIRRNEELNRGKTLTQVIQEENRREEDSGGGSGGGGFGGGSSGGGGDDKIVCTEMYRQTQLVDWQKAMKIWDVYQRRYLTPEHQIGYHWLFKPYVKGMQNNRLLTKLGAILAKKRTQHLKHILTKGKAKDDLVGKLWCSIIHPIVHKAGKIKNFLDSKTKAT